MSALDYLRARARRRKPATGGIVRYDPDRPLQLGGGYLVPTIQPAPAAYEGVTIRMRGYTEMTAEERQRVLDDVAAAMGRPRPATARGGQELRPDSPPIGPNGSTGY